jgi:hypothetical protein
VAEVDVVHENVPTTPEGPVLLAAPLPPGSWTETVAEVDVVHENVPTTPDGPVLLPAPLPPGSRAETVAEMNVVHENVPTTPDGPVLLPAPFPPGSWTETVAEVDVAQENVPTTPDGPVLLPAPLPPGSWTETVAEVDVVHENVPATPEGPVLLAAPLPPGSWTETVAEVDVVHENVPTTPDGPVLLPAPLPPGSRTETVAEVDVVHEDVPTTNDGTVLLMERQAEYQDKLMRMLEANQLKTIPTATTTTSTTIKGGPWRQPLLFHMANNTDKSTDVEKVLPPHHVTPQVVPPPNRGTTMDQIPNPCVIANKDPTLPGHAHDLHPAQQCRRGSGVLPSLAVGRTLDLREEDQSSSLLSPGAARGAMSLEATGSRSGTFTRFDNLLQSTEQVPAVFMEDGKEVYSSPAPASLSYEMDGQDWGHYIEDMVGGDHDGQIGGDDPPACPCHNNPIGSCPGFIQTFVSLVSAVSHHPSGGTNMDGARIELPLRTIHPVPWEQLLCGYNDKNMLANSLRYGWDLSFLPGPAQQNPAFNHPTLPGHAHDLHPAQLSRRGSGVLPSLAVGRTLDHREEDQSSSLLSPGAARGAMLLEATGSRSGTFTQFDNLLQSTEQVPVVFMEDGKEVHSSPAPASLSYEMDGQDWGHYIEDMVGGDHDGQIGGDDPPACPCHNNPIGSCPGFIQTFVSLVSAVSHHPSGGTNMDGARIELPLRTNHPVTWEQLLCGYNDKNKLVNSLRCNSKKQVDRVVCQKKWCKTISHSVPDSSHEQECGSHTPTTIDYLTYNGLSVVGHQSVWDSPCGIHSTSLNSVSVTWFYQENLLS